jgi:hypothetical protein
MSPNLVRYTAIIALTEYVPFSSSGQTIIYLPVTEEDKIDYNIIRDILEIKSERQPKETVNQFITRIVESNSFQEKFGKNYIYVLNLFIKYNINLTTSVDDMVYGKKRSFRIRY